MYSQNLEEQFVLNYFGDYVGTLLSIGENDGVTLSNTRQMILNGWGGYLVEPAPTALKKLSDLYADNEEICIFNYAIGPEPGYVPFYESGSLISSSDLALVSTLSSVEKARWPNTQFHEIKVLCVTPEMLLKKLDFSIDFLSVDCEGLDFYIVSRLPLNEMGVRCLIVEWNGKDGDKYDRLITPQGFQLIHQNGENKIYCHR